MKEKTPMEFKTLCCNDVYYRKSRANFRCKTCDKDVTLDVCIFYRVNEYL